VTCSVPQGSVLGPLLFLIYINDIILARSLNVSYSALFADDLKSIFIFKKPGHIKSIINKYLDSLTSWLSQWRLKMNAKKCCYTIFSNGGRGDLEFDLKLNSEFIPYNPNPVFLGITFDESLCFHTHFENLRARALSRLNIIKIFSHKSWHLSRKTLTCIYRALMGNVGPRAEPPRAGPGFFGPGRPGPLTLGPRPTRPEPGPARTRKARAGPQAF
jgi:hypothetical protein